MQENEKERLREIDCIVAGIVVGRKFPLGYGHQKGGNGAFTLSQPDGFRYNGRYGNLVQEGFEGGMQFSTHTQHGIVVIIAQRRCLIIARFLRKTRRNVQKSVYFFPFYGILSLHFVGKMMGYHQFGGSIHPPDDVSG